ncbi:MAG: glycosyltransferase family 2 protein [Calothrix sp. MO_192.B10]|nr:glycosyltransferase family 2 protein [Calothrix sp. MO_192.B10]
MKRENPRVSIGLPVYNGARFLRTAIEAILQQTFVDFELIISDNASNDATEEICREYAAKDRRIRYYRNKQNIGASPNFNRVFGLARGEYFKWAAHDDVCAPELLERCVAVLDKSPDVVLCHSIAKVIDDNGNLLQKDDDLYVKWTNENIKLRTDSIKPQERFRDLACCPHSCYQVFGLIRTNVLKTTPLIDNYGRSDKVLLARLGLLGRFYEVPENLFFLRRHATQSININAQSVHSFSIWFDPSNRGKIIFPRCRNFFEYFAAIKQVPLPWLDKLACYLTLGELLQQEWQGMAKDLAVATIQILDKFYRTLNSNLNSSYSPKTDLIFNRIPRLSMTKQ